MSWDVSIIKFSKLYASIEQIPDTEKPLPIGSRCSILSTPFPYVANFHTS